MRNIIIALQILTLYSLLSLVGGCRSTEQATIVDEEKIAVANETVEEVIDTVEETALTLTGNVSLPSGEPLFEAEVSIVGAADVVMTEEDGSFTLTTEEKLPIELDIHYPGFVSQRITVSEIKKIEVQLELSDLLLGEELPTAMSEPARDERVVSKSAEITVMDSRVGMSRSSSKRRGEPTTMESMPPPPRRVKGKATNTSAGQLTAAEWNDLHNWQDWKDLLANQDYNDMQSHWQLYPRTRYSIFLRNSYELPIQDARVELLAQNGIVLWSSKTDNAGRAELWADMNSRDKSFETVDARVTVGKEVKTIKDIKTTAQGVNHIDVNVECRTSPNVDIVFAVDATGSMGDEIQYLQSELKDVINRSLASNTNLNVRMGAVFYRDSTDDYVTRVQPLDADATKTINFISEQSAKGGGDYPEAVDAALDEALAQDWSEEAVARIVFLLLDAPPHQNSHVIEKLQKQISDAAKEGIKIIPITASGINRQTEFLMKFMAIATNGTYVFITDHSGIGNPHLDPVVKDFEVEKLNDLLVRLLYNYTKSNGCNANEPLDNGIAVYPNPARDFVNIKSDKPIKTLKVLSNTGKLISTKTDIAKGETRIELSGLVDGMYTIQCQGDEVDFVQPIIVVNR